LVSGILVEDIIPKKGGQCSFYLKLPKIKVFKEKIDSKFDTTEKKLEEKDMRNMMKKAAQNVKAVAVRAGMLMKDTKGENYVDTAVKILIAVVLGALLLAGLYALFGDVVMPTLTQRIQDMFNYAG
jgi:hypothetical protein